MPGDQRQLRAFALLGLVMLLWAGNSIVGRAVRLDVGPLTLSFVRWTGASLLIAPFAWGPLVRDWPEIRRHWAVILLLGVLGIACFNSLLYSGLQHTTATNALLLQAALPPAVMLVDRLLFGVRPTGWTWLGVLVSVLGVVVIVFEGDPASALQLHFGRGDGFVLMAVTAWAFYTVLLRLRPPVSSISFIFVTFLIGVVATGPLAWWEWGTGRAIAWSPGVGAAFLYVATLPSLAAYFMYNHATAVVGAGRAGQTTTLMPLFGALLAAALLGEPLHGFHLVGMALILAGIGIAVLAGLAAGARPRAVSGSPPDQQAGEPR